MKVRVVENQVFISGYLRLSMGRAADGDLAGAEPTGTEYGVPSTTARVRSFEEGVKGRKAKRITKSILSPISEGSFSSQFRSLGFFILDRINNPSTKPSRLHLRAEQCSRWRLARTGANAPTMAQSVGSYTNPLKKFKLVFLGEQSGVFLCSFTG